MEWYKVHDEAEQLEHAVSEEFERRLQEKLGVEDQKCPHGNRIGLDTPEHRRARGWKPWMNSMPTEPSRFGVFSNTSRFAEYFHELGVRPGCWSGK